MDRKLNIAVFGTASLPIPPFHGYGGTQRGIYDFIVNMNNLGHHIHLFGPGDSKVDDLENVVLHAPIKESIWVEDNHLPIETKKEEEEIHYEESLQILKEIDKSERLDIINLRFDHERIMEKVVSNFGNDRVVYSLHNLRNTSRIDAIKRLHVKGVAHCHNHRDEHDSLPNIDVILYGIGVDKYSFSERTLSKVERPEMEFLSKLHTRSTSSIVIP